MRRISFIQIVLVLVTALLLTSCSGKGDNSTTGLTVDGEKLSVVATTTIVGDVVGNIGGDVINLQVLMTPDTDPHSFEPSPQDLTVLEGADVVFINGLGLEEFLGSMVEGIASSDKIVSLSENVKTIQFAGDLYEGDPDEGEHEGEEHDHGSLDPHVWMDPNNIMVWADEVAARLAEIDPANTETYQANALAYKQQLSELDSWIVDQVEKIPSDQRQLVTDHQVFGYFSNRFGFEMIGTVIPGTSTLAEPSAQQLAELEDTIKATGASVIIVSISVNPALAERVANDTGVKLVPLYTGALSAKDGPASTYIEMMRYNVDAIAAALQ